MRGDANPSQGVQHVTHEGAKRHFPRGSCLKILPLFELYKNNKRAVRFVLFSLGLGFVVFLIFQSRNEIHDVIARIKTVEFLAAILVGVVGNFVLAILFGSLLRKHGVDMSYSAATKIHMRAQIAKYIPGKIWSIAYQISHVKGAKAATGILVSNLELMIFSLFITGIIAIMCFCFVRSLAFSGAVFVLGLLVFSMLHKTSFLQKITFRMASKYLKDEMPDNLGNSDVNDFLGVACYSLFCIVYIGSFLLLLKSAFDLSLYESYIYIAILSLSWLGGVLAFVVPLGMGVREFLFVMFSGYLSNPEPFEILLSIALLARVAQILQELLGVVLVQLIKD